MGGVSNRVRSKLPVGNPTTMSPGFSHTAYKIPLFTLWEGDTPKAIYVLNYKKLWNTSGNWQLVHKLGCLLSLGILDMPKNATSTTKLRHQHVSAMVVPRLLWSWYGLLLGSSLRRVNTKDLRSKAGVPYFIFTDKNPPAPLGMVASEDTHPLRSWAFSLRHHQHQKHIWFSKIIW